MTAIAITYWDLDRLVVRALIRAIKELGYEHLDENVSTDEAIGRTAARLRLTLPYASDGLPVRAAVVLRREGDDLGRP